MPFVGKPAAGRKLRLQGAVEQFGACCLRLLIPPSDAAGIVINPVKRLITGDAHRPRRLVDRQPPCRKPLKSEHQEVIQRGHWSIDGLAHPLRLDELNMRRR